MVNGILADVNVVGQVAYLTRLMQAEPWRVFWDELGVTLRTFEEVGLAPTATDEEVWQRCQSLELVPVTDNRNEDSPDSLTATIRRLNHAAALPVFTIADLDKFAASRDYQDEVLLSLYDYLLRIEDVRGTGRLFLP